MTKFKEIAIDFEVFKALLAKRTSEEMTYNDVLRELLGLNKNLPETDKNLPETDEIVNFSDWLNDLSTKNPDLYLRWERFFRDNADHYIIDLYVKIDPEFKRTERNYRKASIWTDFMKKVLDKHEENK